MVRIPVDSGRGGRTSPETAANEETWITDLVSFLFKEGHQTKQKAGLGYIN